MALLLHQILIITRSDPIALLYIIFNVYSHLVFLFQMLPEIRTDLFGKNENRKFYP